MHWYLLTNFLHYLSLPRSRHQQTTTKHQVNEEREFSQAQFDVQRELRFGQDQHQH